MKMASERKKRTPELIISHVGLQGKVGGKLVDAADIFNASQFLAKRNCLEHETVCQTSTRDKKVKTSRSPCVKEAPHFDPPLKQTEVVDDHIIPNAAPLPIQDPRTVTIKATYSEKIIIKFQLSLSAGVADLEEKVIKRLEFKERSFKCKYKDNNGDLVLIACDEDLQTCIGSLSPEDKNIIRLFIKLV